MFAEVGISHLFLANFILRLSFCIGKENFRNNCMNHVFAKSGWKKDKIMAGIVNCYSISLNLVKTTEIFFSPTYATREKATFECTSVFALAKKT